MSLYNIVLYILIGYQMISDSNKQHNHINNNKDNIGRKIVLTSRNIQHVFDLELIDKAGITMAQWKVINTLTTQNGITQREIADYVGLDTSSLIPLIDRLEAKALVERRQDASDRRINRVYLTKKAEALLDSMHSCIVSLKKIVTKGISEDQLEITQQVLERINENLLNHYGVYASKDNNIVIGSRIAESSSSSRKKTYSPRK
ncbi:MAG: MarR family transcriptional regulator [Nitrososphaeraceae archaeon]|nr:MarR family transcriptional regulator [Nitrososphaeraceae archaeon]